MPSPTDQLKQLISSQVEAALCMLDECIRKCPAEHWDGLIAKYPFWQVAYHTLCLLDCCLAPSYAAFQTRPDLHPKGLAELEDEYPSRRFSQEELLRYVAICREKLPRTMANETPETLAGPSGFDWIPLTRAEMHLQSMRHIQHHTGQLGALLRRAGVDTNWVKTGWKEPA